MKQRRTDRRLEKKSRNVVKQHSSNSQRKIYGQGPVWVLLQDFPKRIHAIHVSQRSLNTKLSTITESLKIHLNVCDDKALDDLVGANVLHQGIVAITSPFVYSTMDQVVVDPKALWVVLDGIEDPHNLGAIIRSCYLLGASGVILPRSGAAHITPSVTKTSAGTTEYVSVVQVSNIVRNLNELKKKGFWVTGMDSGTETTINPSQLDATLPTVLVVGNEGKGLSRLVRESCDWICRIPMRASSIDSLNVSVATSVMLYEISRQRGNDCD